MKRFIALALLAATIAATGSQSAPADRYFGKLKMSALRIRYETAQVKNRYETHKLLPEQAEHLAGLAVNAYEDWAKQYPHDTWLASTGYNLAKLYEELPGASARNEAVSLLTYVKTHFPGTKYAVSSASDLRKGVAVRPDPQWAVAMRAAAAPSPAPSTAPSASASASPATSASPPAASSASPPAAPTSAPSPAPTH